MPPPPPIPQVVPRMQPPPPMLLGPLLASPVFGTTAAMMTRMIQVVVARQRQKPKRLVSRARRSRGPHAASGASTEGCSELWDQLLAYGENETAPLCQVAEEQPAAYGLLHAHIEAHFGALLIANAPGEELCKVAKHTSPEAFKHPSFEQRMQNHMFKRREDVKTPAQQGYRSCS